MRIVKDLLFWLLWNPGCWLFLRLPLPVALALGRGLGRVLSRLPSGARSAMERAARVVLGPGAPRAAIQAAARRGIFNLVMNETEALLFPRLRPQNLSRCLAIEGRDRLDAALAQGRGALLLVAHFGANQMVMAGLGHAGYDLYQISAPATALDDKMPGRRSFLFRAALRRRWAHEQSLPARHINVFGPLTRALDGLRRGGLLAVAVDGGHGDNHMPVPFLGRIAQWSFGALELAVHAGCPVLPVFVLRGRDGRNTLVVEPALPQVTPVEASRKEAAGELLRAYVPRLEQRVRAHPCHYLRFLAFRELMAGAGAAPFFTSAADGPTSR